MDRGFQIDFELYKAFYLTAKAENITLAAQQLSLTQPSVTKQIQKLETELRCRLFYRAKGGVSLTPEGRTLLRKIAPACQMILSAEEEMRSLQSLEQGTISIMSTEMGFQAYVLPALEKFAANHPGIRIRFATSLNAQAMLDMLTEGSVDAVIMNEPFRREKNHEIRVIEHMDEYAVCGKRFQSLSDAVRSPEELLAYPFISMPEDSSLMEYLRQYFARYGLAFRADIELTSVDQTARAVERGLGIGVLPAWLAADKLKEGKLFRIPLKHPMPPRDACLITNRRLPPSLAALEFINTLHFV